MANKKICFIVTDAISFNVLFKDQLEYFREYADFDVTLICGGNEEQLEILRKRLVGTVVNAKFERKISLVKDIGSLLFLTSYLISNNFDIIVYSTPKALLLGSITSFFSIQGKRVAVVQGRAYENFVGLKRIIFQAFDKLSFTASNSIIFVSNSLFQNYIDEKIIDKHAGKVIMQGSFNGVNVELFKPVSLEQKSKLRKNLSLPVDDFLVCIVGRICTDKGIKEIDILTKKMANVNLKFVFVGSFEDDEGESVVSDIVDRGQGFYIPFTSKVHEIFQSSDLHLFLSHREGFGNVAIEAASCGVPTFAYDVVGIKDSVSEGVSGKKFTFKDTENIAKEIKKAANNPNFKLEYKLAREWAVQNFEQEVVWQNYLDFYLQNV